MNNDFTLNLGGAAKPAVHGECEEKHWEITMADTGEDTYTGARIKRIEKYIDTDTFLLTYGDAVSNVNIKELVQFHQKHGKIGTITAVHPLSRFGEIHIGQQGAVTKFAEKAMIKGDHINGGFFVFNRRIFDYVNTDDSCIFEGPPLEKLSEDKQLVAYIHNDYWQCMDTYRDWQILDNAWQNGNPPWLIW